MKERVAICIVTYNSADDLADCMRAVKALDHRPLELIIVDCASSDDSVAIARRVKVGKIAKRVVALEQNRGFAGGMNEAIARSDAPWILALNADARPRVDFLSRLLTRADSCHGFEVAAVTGRLLRFEAGGTAAKGAVRLDACGMRLIPAWRHLDRGSGELDRGQFMEPEYVFGGTGAATLYRRRALDDVAFEDGSIFDPLFHSYREDAELCFRFQERDWQVVYEPAAVAEHRRRVVPQNRRQVAAAINRHSLKNRYLLRAYHQTVGNFLRTFPHTTLRDVAALAYVVLFERSSLSAYTWLWRHRRQILERRRYLLNRRTNFYAVDTWFSVSSFPLNSADTSNQGSGEQSSGAQGKSTPSS